MCRENLKVVEGKKSSNLRVKQQHVLSNSFFYIASTDFTESPGCFSVIFSTYGATVVVDFQRLEAG